MPIKKKSSTAARKPAASAQKTLSSGGVSSMASAQFKQLQKSVAQLTTRLEKEVKANTTASKVIAEAKKARDGLAAQMKTLRDEGSYLTRELKRALGDAEKREAARKQAVEKLAELRAELAHRTDELKRKSEELAKLARDSAGRAKDIIMSGGEPMSKGEPMDENENARATASEPPTVETDSESAETVRLEESPQESSIEEEIHPERKD
jgi:chromosome segregation ATPase